MANYILVHGGDRDGSIWSSTASLLKLAGHQVICPSMKSVKHASLDENIAEILEVAQSFQEFILIGHSYAAMVITGVADKISEKISHLIFVDSVIPKNGQSLYGMLEELGVNYQDFGLTPDRACLAPLYFDQKKLNEINKTYIRALNSEFLIALNPIYKNILANKEKDHWSVFCLDASHGCMLTHSEELAVIFSGVQIINSHQPSGI